MFKDKREELERLEAELLQEELLEEEEQETPEEEDYFFGEETPETYRNYSNDYGRYQAYNSDRTDEDLEAYSEEVREPNRRKDIWTLCAIAFCLLVAILGILGWWAIRFLGR